MARTASSEAAPLLHPARGPRFYLLSVIHMSICFFMLFTAFTGISNIESSIVSVPNVGFIAIAVLYFVFAFACLVTPVVVGLLTPRWSIVLAFCGFLTFCAANVIVAAYPTDVALAWGALVTGGTLTGLAASFLWTAQGTYLTACAYQYAIARRADRKSALGLFSGLFFGIFQLTQVSGNLMESLILSRLDAEHSSPVPLFVVYLCCACAGTVLAVFLRPVATPATEAVEDTADRATGVTRETPDPIEKPPSAAQLLLKTVRLWRDPLLILLIPLIFLSGLEQGWVSSYFTRFFVSPALGKDNIGYVMTCFGVADSLGSIALGKLSDVIGRAPVLLIGFVCQAGVAVVLHLAPVQHGDWTTLLITAAAWGIGDATWNTQIYAILGDVFPDNLEGAFANLKLWQSLLAGSAWLLGSVLDKQPRVYLELLLAVLGASIVGAMIVLWVHRKRKRRAAGPQALATGTSAKPTYEKVPADASADSGPLA